MPTLRRNLPVSLLSLATLFFQVILISFPSSLHGIPIPQSAEADRIAVSYSLRPAPLPFPPPYFWTPLFCLSTICLITSPPSGQGLTKIGPPELEALFPPIFPTSPSLRFFFSLQVSANLPLLRSLYLPTFPPDRFTSQASFSIKCRLFLLSPCPLISPFPFSVAVFFFVSPPS